MFSARGGGETESASEKTRAIVVKIPIPGLSKPPYLAPDGRSPKYKLNEALSLSSTPLMQSRHGEPSATIRVRLR